MTTVATAVTPAELGQFLDAVASAPIALRDVPRVNSILDRLVRLANGGGPIGTLRNDAYDPPIVVDPSVAPDAN